MHPLLLPPRLILRALDDLHALALAAPDAIDQLRSLEDRATSVEILARDVLTVIERLEGRVDDVRKLGDRLPGGPRAATDTRAKRGPATKAGRAAAARLLTRPDDAA